jgi:hypothetical protein
MSVTTYSPNESTDEVIDQMVSFQMDCIVESGNKNDSSSSSETKILFNEA